VALKESDKSRQYEISNFELYNILDGELLCVEVILEEQRPNTVVCFSNPRYGKKDSLMNVLSSSFFAMPSLIVLLLLLFQSQYFNEILHVS
jgi:hypothetical protein